jgi:hypothetical protein
LQGGRVEPDGRGQDDLVRQSLARERRRDGAGVHVLDVGEDDDRRARLVPAREVGVEALDAAAVRDVAEAPVLAHADAVGVAVFERRGHRFERLRREEFAAVERLIPEVEVFDGRVERAGPVRDAHVYEVGVVESAVAQHVAGGAARQDFVVAVEAGARHAGGGEEVLAEELLVRLAREFLDEMAEQDVAAVAVVEALAGRELKRLVAEALEGFGDGRREAARLPVLGERGEARHAGGVRQEVVDGDGLPRLGALRDVLADRVRDGEPAALLQEEDGRGRELLGDGAEAELGLRRVRHVQLVVRHAVALAEEHAAVARDERRAAEALARG